MKAESGFFRSNTSVVAGCLVVLGALGALSACGGDVAPPATQYGASPPLPEPRQYLVPPMKVPSAGSWSEGQTPTVAQGLQIRPWQPA